MKTLIKLVLIVFLMQIEFVFAQITPAQVAAITAAKNWKCGGGNAVSFDTIQTKSYITKNFQPTRGQNLIVFCNYGVPAPISDPSLPKDLEVFWVYTQEKKIPTPDEFLMDAKFLKGLPNLLASRPVLVIRRSVTDNWMAFGSDYLKMDSCWHTITWQVGNYLNSIGIDSVSGFGVVMEAFPSNSEFTGNEIAADNLRACSGGDTTLVIDLGDSTDVVSAIVNLNLIPNKFKLYQNYPNPFNPSTKIRFSVSSPGLVSLKVYNILGQEITTLVNEEKSKGSYEVTFNASNLPSGIYFYRLQVSNFIETKKMNLLK